MSAKIGFEGPTRRNATFAFCRSGESAGETLTIGLTFKLSLRKPVSEGRAFGFAFQSC